MSFTTEIIDFTDLSKKDILSKLQELNIPLTADEALKIQIEMLGRPPSLTELVLFSIQGSEHCSYKSSRSHLKNFITNSPDVVLGAKEDAGVISVAKDNKGNRWCIVMSHESHNHPSQIVPYEGAATGIGGNVRDVMCMGAKVIACTDSLRFGEIDRDKTKWIQNGVIQGIAGYANPIGVPNIGGDLYYNKGYNENCLVTIVTLGIVREDHIIHSYAPEKADGYDLILIGKATDNSGFGGASFASLKLEEEKEEQNKGAVQEPNAFLERHLLKSTYKLFDIIKEKNLINQVGFKDLGAGGVACASVELAETSGYGSEVWMDKIHTSMKNLHPSVYLCSETQERFMWVCSPKITPLILDHYNSVFDLPNVSSGAKASVVGKIRKDGQFIVHDKEIEIVNAKAEEVTRGFLYDRPIKSKNINQIEPDLKPLSDFNSFFLSILSHENIASREPIFETYDKQVQGRTYVEAGISDAGVLTPFNSDNYPKEIQSTAIALSTDHNPRYGLISPYWCGVNAVVESMRNVASVGAIPHAISDCLCFGNPENPHQMWEFVESVRGINDACQTITLKEHKNHATPIIAGNVSFYNESTTGAIPPSPIVSCLGVIKDYSKIVPSSFQSSESTIILIGERKNELGGSVYYDLSDELGTNIPKPDLEEVKNQIFAITDCIDRSLILSCHDISDGGIATALAEMAFCNNLGFEVNLMGDQTPEVLLFTETGGFLLEVGPSQIKQAKNFLSSLSINFSEIGFVTSEKVLNINNLIKLPIIEAKNAWQNGLREKL